MVRESTCLFVVSLQTSTNGRHGCVTSTTLLLQVLAKITLSLQDVSCPFTRSRRRFPVAQRKQKFQLGQTLKRWTVCTRHAAKGSTATSRWPKTPPTDHRHSGSGEKRGRIARIGKCEWDALSSLKHSVLEPICHFARAMWLLNFIPVKLESLSTT